MRGGVEGILLDAFAMERRKRIEYLVTTTCVFLSCFFMFGFISIMPGPFVINNKIKTFLLFGCTGGFGFSSALSAIILTGNFMQKRSLCFKIISAIFWILTFMCAFYVNFFAYIPYQIYNIIKIIKDKPQ